MKKTFCEKLNDTSNVSKVVFLGDKPDFVKRYGGEYMLIANPLEYNEIMLKIPYGKVITMDRVRNYLAKKHNADMTCSLTAGIFTNIVAHASVEREKSSAGNLVCFWRTLKKDGELNEKYPGGIEYQKLMLESEGHEVIQKGKKYFVKDYESKLHNL